MRKVFISYARQNRPEIDQLAAHLRVVGCETWLDSSLYGGEDWWIEILRRISDCDTFIAIISRAALDSTACRREFDWAEALGKPVLPVAVEPPPRALPRRFSRRQIIDYSDPAARDQAALTLAGGLATLPPAPPLPDPLPEAPAAPLSYLTDLVEVVSQPAALDHGQQLHILKQLEPALRSVDPEERRGARDILEMLAGRRDLYADLLPTIDRLRTVDQHTPFGAQQAIAPGSAVAPPSAQTANYIPNSATTAPAAREFDDHRRVPRSSRRPPRSRPAPTAGSSTERAAATVPADELRSSQGSRESLEIASVSPRQTTGRPSAMRPPVRRLGGRIGIAVVAGVAAVIATVVLLVVFLPGGTTSRTAGSASPPASASPYAPQIVLPFTGLDGPNGAAVDSTGNLYVTDARNNRVLRLAKGSTTPDVLPFTGLIIPAGVAVDGAGNLYVADSFNNRVLRLAAGSPTPDVLPFTGLNDPQAVAVDGAGNIYVTEGLGRRVLRLAKGSAAPDVLPFTGLFGPPGAAVDGAGNLYVADSYNNRVLRLAKGSATPDVLPFTGLAEPMGVAVDGADNLYVADLVNNRVLKLAAGSATPDVLPCTGLNGPHGVAVDGAGNLYVTDDGNNRVLKMPVQ